ncbi:MAG TPA: LysR substrate-binding domain-containing protein [Candidatus Limnocylindrales bacterium]|nr:LysR substrate-binding domain-containing protein [Candidatus Limnocylindrales bacterium]
MDMQVAQLRAFLAVAERRHFTRAARDLGMAQPSVSAHVRRLEAELGSDLFHRMKGNLTLTPGGEALLPFARRILADVDAATAELSEVGGLARGRIVIGATPSLAATLVPPVLARFHAAHPGIELALKEAGSMDLVRALQEGAVDVALVILPVRHDVLETQPLLREELVVAVTRAHPLAKRRTLAVSDLRDVPLVMFREGYDLRSATEAACRAAGFAPTLAVEGGEMDGVLRLTAAGLGAAIVPSLVIERGGPLRAIRMKEPALTRTIGLAHRRDRRLSHAAAELIETVRALVRDRSWLKTSPAGLTVLR